MAGDDGIERKIPLTQVKSVEYSDSAKAVPASPAAQLATQSAKAVKETPLPRQQQDRIDLRVARRERDFRAHE